MGKSFKEGMNEFMNGLKEDKKKLFFVIGIPLILFISIVLGIYYSKNDDVTNSTDTKVAGIIQPVVDSVEIKNNIDKKSTDIYKESFFGSSENTGKNVDFLSETKDEKLEPEAKTSTNLGGSTYQYKSPYDDNDNVSNINSKPVNKVTKPIETTVPEEVSEIVVDDGRRRRNPSDSYGNLSGGKKSNESGFMKAVIANDNRLVKSSSYVSIRLGEELTIDGQKIPRNTIITGLARMGTERMDIVVSSVRIGNVTKSVNWSIYDQDGVKGIRVPENILNNIGKDIVNEGIDKGSTSIGANIPIIGSVNVNLKKKNQQIEFVLNNGHKIYIKSEK